jgi:hypothetical protein
MVLPLRQVLHVALPGENDYRVEAEIVTDFSGFDRQQLAAAAPPFSLAALVAALGSADRKTWPTRRWPRAV